MKKLNKLQAILKPTVLTIIVLCAYLLLSHQIS